MFNNIKLYMSDIISHIDNLLFGYSKHSENKYFKNILEDLVELRNKCSIGDYCENICNAKLLPIEYYARFLNTNMTSLSCVPTGGNQLMIKSWKSISSNDRFVSADVKSENFVNKKTNEICKYLHLIMPYGTRYGVQVDIITNKEMLKIDPEHKYIEKVVIKRIA